MYYTEILLLLRDNLLFGNIRISTFVLYNWSSNDQKHENAHCHNCCHYNVIFVVILNYITYKRKFVFYKEITLFFFFLFFIFAYYLDGVWIRKMCSLNGKKQGGEMKCFHTHYVLKQNSFF